MANQYSLAPVFIPADISNRDLKDVADKILKSKNGSGPWAQLYKNKIVADYDAVEFYMLNQAFGLFRQKSTLNAGEDFVAKLYVEATYSQVARLFVYMLLIVTRESRHLHNKSSYYSAHLDPTDAQDVLWQDFHSNMDGGSDGAVKHLLHSAPEGLTLGHYLKKVEHCFYKGKYSGGYGGKPWGQITTLLRKFVYGEITGEILCDQAYTLCHNNGPMFNKGMLYKGYTQTLLKLLDMQHEGKLYPIAAGQSSGKVAAEVMSSMKVIYKMVSENAPFLMDALMGGAGSGNPDVEDGDECDEAPTPAYGKSIDDVMYAMVADYIPTGNKYKLGPHEAVEIVELKRSSHEVQ